MGVQTKPSTVYSTTASAVHCRCGFELYDDDT